MIKGKFDGGKVSVLGVDDGDYCIFFFEYLVKKFLYERIFRVFLINFVICFVFNFNFLLFVMNILFLNVYIKCFGLYVILGLFLFFFFLIYNLINLKFYIMILFLN